MQPVPLATPVAYTVREAAEALRCSRTHIYELIARGEIRRVKIGHRTIVPASEVRRLAEQGTEE